MPQADLYFTTDQTLAPAEALRAVEAVIDALDGGAGASKGRAHRISDFHHSHILLSLSMLPKPHRDAAFADELGKQLAETLKPLATADCSVHVHIRFDLVHYTSVNPRRTHSD